MENYQYFIIYYGYTCTTNSQNYGFNWKLWNLYKLWKKLHYTKNNGTIVIYHIKGFFLIGFIKIVLFSSPELKSQISFSERLLFVVCLIIYHIWTSSIEPLGQFQPNMVQSILQQRVFKFVQMRVHAVFQGDIIKK